MKILLPEGWPRPRGFSNGISATGRQIFLSGQIGWLPDGSFESEDFPDQFRQTLKNIIAVLEAGGAEPGHIVRMTWFVTDKQDYLCNQRALGDIWKDLMGAHYPVMSVLEVAALLENKAKIEIEVTAVVPED